MAFIHALFLKLFQKILLLICSWSLLLGAIVHFSRKTQRKKDQFKKKEQAVIDSLQSEFDFSDKPPSQRLRAVLYRMWEQDNEGFKDSNLHYIYHMNKVIEHFKSKLD